MKRINAAEFSTYERFYRANLLNSISGYKQVALIGTSNRDGLSNLGLFSSIVHLGADPALIGYIQRPVSGAGDTYRNIMEKGYYSINLVPEKILEQAHYTSAKFPSDVSEFSTCRLTEEYSPGFPAPFVFECPVKIGMKLVEVVPITYNNTRLVIGAVELLMFPKASLRDDGNLDLSVANLVSVTGLETYHRMEKIATYPYAKANAVPDFGIKSNSI